MYRNRKLCVNNGIVRRHKGVINFDNFYQWKIGVHGHTMLV